MIERTPSGVLFFQRQDHCKSHHEGTKNTKKHEEKLEEETREYGCVAGLRIAYDIGKALSVRSAP
jgi:hypothetical protein